MGDLDYPLVPPLYWHFFPISQHKELLLGGLITFPASPRCSLFPVCKHGPLLPLVFRCGPLGHSAFYVGVKQIHPNLRLAVNTICLQSGIAQMYFLHCAVDGNC